MCIYIQRETEKERRREKEKGRLTYAKWLWLYMVFTCECSVAICRGSFRQPLAEQNLWISFRNLGAFLLKRFTAVAWACWSILIMEVAKILLGSWIWRRHSPYTLTLEAMVDVVRRMLCSNSRRMLCSSSRFHLVSKRLRNWPWRIYP